MLAALRKYGDDLMSGLLEQAHELKAFVCGNSSADDQQYSRHGAHMHPPAL
jgi:hypothetical protein